MIKSFFKDLIFEKIIFNLKCVSYVFKDDFNGVFRRFSWFQFDVNGSYVFSDKTRNNTKILNFIFSFLSKTINSVMLSQMYKIKPSSSRMPTFLNNMSPCIGYPYTKYVSQQLEQMQHCPSSYFLTVGIVRIFFFSLYRTTLFTEKSTVILTFMIA